MLNIPTTSLWLGNVADLRDIPAMHDCDVTAIIDLAMEEPLPQVPRTLNYCRFAVSDDGENDSATIRTAITSASCFLAGGHVTAICCNAGLSRSPTIAAAALAYVTTDSPQKCLKLVATVKQVDIKPALWNQVVGILEEIRTIPRT